MTRHMKHNELPTQGTQGHRDVTQPIRAPGCTLSRAAVLQPRASGEEEEEEENREHAPPKRTSPCTSFVVHTRHVRHPPTTPPPLGTAARHTATRGTGDYATDRHVPRNRSSQSARRHHEDREEILHRAVVVSTGYLEASLGRRTQNITRTVSRAGPELTDGSGRSRSAGRTVPSSAFMPHVTHHWFVSGEPCEAQGGRDWTTASMVDSMGSSKVWVPLLPVEGSPWVLLGSSAGQPAEAGGSTHRGQKQEDLAGCSWKKS
ncbi:unnamed protein product [Arctogadus glacialis]